MVAISLPPRVSIRFFHGRETAGRPSGAPGTQLPVVGPGWQGPSAGVRERAVRRAVPGAADRARLAVSALPQRVGEGLEFSARTPASGVVIGGPPWYLESFMFLRPAAVMVAVAASLS